MFCLPKDIVKKIVNGEIGYDGISKDMRNEIFKEDNLKGQARVNLSLGKNHAAVCSVLEEACKKEDCVLFKKGEVGYIGNGSVCREYKVDFPTADFDLRYHVALVGTDKVNIKASIENFEELKRQGARYYCLGCGNVYKEKQEKLKAESEMLCSCEDFLFKDIDFFINFLKSKEKRVAMK